MKLFSLIRMFEMLSLFRSSRIGVSKSNILPGDTFMLPNPVSDPLLYKNDGVVLVFVLLIIYALLCTVLLLFCPFYIKSKESTHTFTEGLNATVELYAYGTAVIREVKWRKANSNSYLLDPRCSTSEHGECFSFRYSCILTMKEVTISDDGEYECIISNYGKLPYCSIKKFYLHISPHPGAPIITHTKDLIEQHKRDKTYHRTTAVYKGVANLESNNILLLLGHEGCGKTKMCLEIARQYIEEGYTVFMQSTDEIYHISTQRKELHIYDVNLKLINFGNIGSSLVKKIKPYSEYPNLRFIITVLTSYQMTALDKAIYDGENQISLNTISKEEKKAILRKHMLTNNIEECDKYYETNYDDPDVCSDKNKTVKIYRKTFDDIIDIDTLIGFPTACEKFCRNRSLLRLEDRYFNNPPMSVVQDMNAYRYGPTGMCSPEYVVLVYILMNQQLNLDIIKEHMNDIESICDKVKVQPFPLYSVKDAAERLIKKFLKYDRHVYSFSHSSFSKAIWISYMDIEPQYCMTSCHWNYINDLVRPKSWPSDENEVCIRVNNDVLLQRLNSEIERGYGSAWSVGQFLRKLSIHGIDLTNEFCIKYLKKNWDIDSLINFYSGISELGSTFEMFQNSPAALQMLVCPNIDKDGNCLLHYCVLQDYHKILSQISDSAAEFFMNTLNKKGYSPCHLMFHMGKVYINKKHLALIPRTYDYYTKLNRLFHTGKRNSGKVLGPKHFNVTGEITANVMKMPKFGNEDDFDLVQKELLKVKNETMMMVRLEDVPPGLDDKDVENELMSLNCTILNFYHEKYRQKGRLTNIKTGDRIAICKPLNNSLPESILVKNEFRIKLSYVENKKRSR